MSSVAARLRDHRRLTAALVLVVVAAIAVTIVVVRSLDRSPRAQAGEVWFDGSIDDDRGAIDSVEIPLPDGALRLTVGAPRDRLLQSADDLDPDGTGPEDPETLVRAPDAGVLVPIDLERVDDPSVGTTVVGPTPAPDVVQDVTPDPVVVVATAGEDVGLGTQLSDARALQDLSTAMVALPGDGTTLTVRISFDGETQEVDVEDGEVVGHRTGRFAVYDEDDPVEEPLTTAAEVGDGFALGNGPGSGDLDVVRGVRVPWVAGLGWAADGDSWVAVEVAPRGPLPLERGPLSTRYDVPDLSAATFRLDGEPARAVSAAAGVASNPGTTLAVFAADETGPVGDVRIDLDLEVVRGPIGADALGTAPVSWTVPLPVTG